MYIICFFFFKQKTAYEMRISDWSSDVCSSDLTFSSLDVLKTLLPRMADGGFALKAPVAYRVEADPARVEAFERRRQLRQQMAELDRQRRELCGEIGRASCRERVCQYV